MAKMSLACIDAPHFCAGAVVFNNTVTCAAPIIKYMVGWTPERVESYCAKKKWGVYWSEMVQNGNVWEIE